MAPPVKTDMPASEPQAAHVKATREDWLTAAKEVLIRHGAADVKVLSLGKKLGVSRSSFYWYFKDRKDLLQALLADWETRNTRSITAKCEQPAADITDAVCNFFRCFIDEGLFDQGLDFAVREWSRRDKAVRKLIDAADAARIASITAMFQRFGYDAQDADARARILYFMQLGYHALEVREPMDLRMSRLEPYLKGFIGCDPDPHAMAEFRAFALSRP
jgi:AcrR family transcriptional regulator